jgi:hypothetical protein
MPGAADKGAAAVVVASTPCCRTINRLETVADRHISPQVERSLAANAAIGISRFSLLSCGKRAAENPQPDGGRFGRLEVAQRLSAALGVGRRRSPPPGAAEIHTVQ